jgi:hypothetical protein
MSLIQPVQYIPLPWPFLERSSPEACLLPIAISETFSFANFHLLSSKAIPQPLTSSQTLTLIFLESCRFSKRALSLNSYRFEFILRIPSSFFLLSYLQLKFTYSTNPRQSHCASLRWTKYKLSTSAQAQSLSCRILNLSL